MYEGYRFPSDDLEQFERLKDEFNLEGIYYMDEEDGYFIVRKNVISDEQKAYCIRTQRKYECFPVINRGNFWYDNLSTEQKSELRAWYREWLDAPDTLVIPEKPSWLN